MQLSSGQKDFRYIKWKWNTVCIFLHLFTPPLLSLLSGAGSVYHLQVSQVLWGCVCRCWAERIYLPPLAHRFWKLTLQLLSRYAKFVTEVRLDLTDWQPHSWHHPTEIQKLQAPDIKMSTDVTVFQQYYIPLNITVLLYHSFWNTKSSLSSQTLSHQFSLAKVLLFHCQFISLLVVGTKWAVDRNKYKWFPLTTDHLLNSLWSHVWM